MEVLQRTANRGSVSTGPYQIDNSVKLECDNNEWFYRASPTEGNRRTFTFSFWIKRTGLGTVNASGVQYVAGQGQHGRMYFTNDYFGFRFDDGHDTRDITTLHRDTAAWLHVVVAVDTNQSSSSNRVKIYFNGVQTTAIDFDGGSYPDIQDQASGWFTTNYLTVGTAPFGGSYNVGDGDYDMRGYLAEFCAVDGQQLAPTDFGEFDSDSGIWKPIDVSGINFGSQGYYLNFADAADLGDDESGNSNDFTENNITSADQSQDSPTNNFATFNVLQPRASGTTITKGGTDFYINSNYQTAVSSIAVSSGKWYAEFSPDSHSTFVGFVDVEDAYVPQNHTGYYLGYAGGNQNRSVGMKGTDGAIYNDNNSASGATFGASDIISLALDMDNRKAYWAVNGTYVNSGNPSNGTNGVTWATSSTLGDAWTDVITMGVTGYSNIHWKCNFGGYTDISISSGNSDANGYGNFEYAVPSGFYALCTKNLAEYG